MSMLVNSKLAADIGDALGLKNVITLDLHFAINAIATADVTFFPEDEQGRKLPALLKRYTLQEQASDQPQGVPCP